MSTKDQEQTKIDNLELLLSQVIEQQEMISGALANVADKVGQLHQEIATFKNRVEGIKVEMPPVDLAPVKAEVNRGIYKVIHAIIQKPQAVVRKFEILLFPPQDAKLFYKIVFGRWLMWLAIVVGVMYLYQYVVHWQNSQTTLEILRLEKGPIIKGWHNLYNSSGKNLRQKMDSILLSAIKKPGGILPETSNSTDR
ncbi:hypothetical protein [Paraflavitalea sp. CAU 1676]|uniref:hypothetical protein n=1 Tax=Paraflavitalea sp. CAU 1676 TaxID=3032598 RepID=UPI0023DA1705|nr:hypothetical protein [Paraflavitalea sp. CAU 1676]MDF2189827.1 hypothetical protein [Paraflavitalea sp. CAU 1676]